MDNTLDGRAEERERSSIPTITPKDWLVLPFTRWWH